MDLPQILMLAVVSASLWLGRWNGTCWALALSYFSVQCWWLLAGTLQPGDLFMVDLVTILLIYCKAIARDTDCEMHSGWEQVKCFILVPTPRDRIILISFPAAVWPVYIWNIDAFAQWWALYFLSALQFLIAGSEAIDKWRSAKAPVTEADTPSSGSLRVAWGWTGDG